MNIQDARIARQPNATDEQEVAIRKRLDELFSSKKAQETIRGLREDQAEFLEYGLKHLQDDSKIRAKYESLLHRLADTMQARIASGEEHLESVKEHRGVIFLTNHFGIAKLTRIDNKEHRFSIELDEIEPFTIRPAALVRVSEKLGFPIFETAIELPPPLLNLQKATGVITIPLIGGGRTEIIRTQIENLVKREQRPAIVMYPEGGTSGKRNNAGPYDLGTFQTGAFVVAAQTGLPILPICQYFDPEYGMKLYVLKPLIFRQENLDNVGEIAQQTQDSMQTTLDNLTHSK